MRSLCFSSSSDSEDEAGDAAASTEADSRPPDADSEARPSAASAGAVPPAKAAENGASAGSAADKDAGAAETSASAAWTISSAAASSAVIGQVPVIGPPGAGVAAEEGISQPTMWLGTEDGYIHVYSCCDNIRIKRNKTKIQHGAAVHCIM